MSTMLDLLIPDTDDFWRHVRVASACGATSLSYVGFVQAQMHDAAMRRLHPPFQMPAEKPVKPKPSRVTTKGHHS